MVLLDLGPGPATPPWLPLLMVLVLLALIGFLYWSMSRNLNRIDFDDRPPGSPVSPVPPAAPVPPVSPAPPTPSVPPLD